MGDPFLEERKGGLGVYPERSRRASIFSEKEKDLCGIYPELDEGIPIATFINVEY